MKKTNKPFDSTREVVLEHVNTYPKLQPQDIFKLLFQSAFGCEHLVSSFETALKYINAEYSNICKTEKAKIEKLDGGYKRVYLSCLNQGLRAETLAKLFCLSAKTEPEGRAFLEEKLQGVNQLLAENKLPFDENLYTKSLKTWREAGYPAVHHSQVFRDEYKPAYRVITDLYADFLPIFTQIDRLLDKGNVVVAIEGGSASGKTTLAGILEDVYSANVIHMDDFFLRPNQRTAERLAEVGGNVDRERFYDEVIKPLNARETITYSPFDCSTQTLKEPVTLQPKKLTVIEGVYSTHPAFSKYYDLAIFLDIDKALQKARVLKRNTPAFAKRFFEEWIPLEDIYFEKTQIKERCFNQIIKYT